MWRPKDIFKEYFSSMRDGCLYGHLVRETFEVQRWVQQKWTQLVRLELLAQRSDLAQTQILAELQGIEQEVQLEQLFVPGLLQQGQRYAQHDPDDPVLPSDLAQLEDDWNRLGHALLNLANWPSFGLILTKEQYSHNRYCHRRTTCTCTGIYTDHHNPQDVTTASTQTQEYYTTCNRSNNSTEAFSNLFQINSCESDLGSSTITLCALSSSSSSTCSSDESFYSANEFEDDLSNDEDWSIPDDDCHDDRTLSGLKDPDISFAKMNLAGADQDSGRSSPLYAAAAASAMAAPSTGRPESLSVSPPRIVGGRPFGLDESPVLPKRRKIFHDDTPSSVGSPRDSPVNMARVGELLGVSLDEFNNHSRSFDDSNVSSPSASPATFRRQHDFRRRYKKDELWRAIASDYEYLMDDAIVETCKSTESDLSWESDHDLTSDTNVSFTEFMQQYTELTDWLNHIQLVTQRQSCSLSEKYLNQTYHEEMLRSSPRRKLFNGYAKQLMRRYPNMKEEINARLHYLNSQWEGLLKAICPSHGYQDEQTMLQDLEQDLTGLKKWLHEVECRLLPLSVRPEWTKLELQEKLVEHKALQKDIESHSKIFSAVLKLCDRLSEEGRGLDKLAGQTLEHRWHTVLLQALEWQFRLEEAIAGGKVRVRQFPSEEDISGDWSDVSSNRADDSYVDILGRVQRNSDDVDSDQSNFDVIPFSENEYEKIQVDSESQTESCAERVTPELADVTGRQAQRCDSSDQGIDSALGRSLSDRSLEKERSSGVPHSAAAFCLTRDQVNIAASKVLGQEDVEMRAVRGSAAPAVSTLKEHKCENHDVGYGSESYSNDESQPAALPTDKLQAVYEAQGVSQEDMQRVVLRRRSPEPMQVNGYLQDDVDSPGHDPTWRHSMTSAYDTSSNCSDGGPCLDDIETSLDTTVETEVHMTETSDTGLSSSVEVNSEMVRDMHNKVKTLMKSPSQDFYRMTMIETDSEPTSAAYKVNPNEECKSGATTDAESELSKSLELPFDDVPVRPAEGATVIKANGISKDSHHAQAFPAPQDAINSIKSKSSLPESNGYTNVSLDEVAAKLSACENADQEAVNCQSNGLSPDPARVFRPINGSYTASNSNVLLDSPSVTHNAVQSLFNHAEAMAREGDILTQSPCKFPEEKPHKQQKRKSKRKLDATGGGMLLCTESSQLSSCDASSEGVRSSSESDSDTSDFSALGSDDEILDHSAILIAGSHSTSSNGEATLCGSRSLSCSPHKEGGIVLRNKSCTRQHGDRPHSITALYELTSGLDLTQFSTSISEGAIDSLRRGKEPLIGHKLRRTTSDTLKRFDTPRKNRRRRSKRAGSDEKLSSSPLQLHSTPLPSRNQSAQEERLSSTQGEESGDHSRHCRRSLDREIARHDASGLESAGPAHLPLPARCLDSDTDPQTQSLNSTLDNEPEQAWDPFQLAPYSSVSDDPTEEKQDASHLQGEWEHCLEFDDEFQLDSYGGGRPKTNSKLSPHASFLEASSRTLDDSDSDLEDFEHCIEESKKAINFTESMLRNARDPMGTKIFLDPSEYNDPLATCQTNMKCLQVIIDTLESEKGLTNVTDEHIQHVYDLIEQWRDLEILARTRQQQSQDLSAIFEDILGMKKCLSELEDELATDGFSDVTDLVRMISLLQEKHMALGQTQGPQLLKLGSRVSSFSRKNRDVPMQKFTEQVSLLQQSHTDIEERSKARLVELQPQLLAWYDYSETQRELVYLLQRQRDQLRCVELAPSVVNFSEEDVKDTIQDLKANELDYVFLESKLHSLRQLSTELSEVASPQSQAEMRAELAHLDHELSATRQRCRDLEVTIEACLEAGRQDEAAAVDTPAAETKSADGKLLDEDDADCCAAKRPSTFQRFLRWLKRSMPMQAALVIMFAVLYLLHPNGGENAGAYCIRLSPELRYVRGPPPM